MNWNFGNIVATVWYIFWMVLTYPVTWVIDWIRHSIMCIRYELGLRDYVNLRKRYYIAIRDVVSLAFRYMFTDDLSEEEYWELVREINNSVRL